MKFSIGYQLPDQFDSIPDICHDFREHISNVYFSWGNAPSGRSPLCSSPEQEDDVKKIQLADLMNIKREHISLTLLLNANCYGGKSLSNELKDQILTDVTFLKDRLDIERITTTSPYFAECIRKKFGKSISIIASANMRIGTLQAMQQLSNLFDGYYLQKELNRNLTEIHRLKNWCVKHDKKLHILANSGCLAYCGFQTFHDNLVAHESEILKEQNDFFSFPAPCWKYLHELDTENACVQVLQSNWIRPEEVELYEPVFDEMKLATRMHSRPRMVIRAYIKGHFTGNILDLTEPSYSSLLKGVILDNTLFPPEYHEKITHCTHNCSQCDLCVNTAKKSMVSFNK